MRATGIWVSLLLVTIILAPACADEPQVLKLWPGEAPNETGKIGAEENRGEPQPLRLLGFLRVAMPHARASQFDH